MGNVLNIRRAYTMSNSAKESTKKNPSFFMFSKGGRVGVLNFLVLKSLFWPQKAYFLWRKVTFGVINIPGGRGEVNNLGLSPKKKTRIFAVFPLELSLNQ